jgi:transposase
MPVLAVIPYLKLHLILDNYGTNAHPTVKDWLSQHSRFTLHFTPTGASWLNLVERWFRELTDKRIRRGVFHSVTELKQAIREFLNTNNGICPSEFAQLPQEHHEVQAPRTDPVEPDPKKRSSGES